MKNKNYLEQFEKKQKLIKKTKAHYKITKTLIKFKMKTEYIKIKF